MNKLEKISLYLCGLMFLISCGTVKHGVVNKFSDSSGFISFPKVKAKHKRPVRIITVHDTILKQRPQLNPTQIQGLLDSYFAPKFDGLRSIIKSQASSIKNLTVMYGDMRQRAISNRNKYDTRDSSQRSIIADYQKQIVDIQKANLRAVKLQTASNQQQIQNSNKIIRYLAIGLFVLLFAVIGLYLFNIFLYKRIKQLQKSLNYV